jgi:hypothetical protein
MWALVNKDNFVIDCLVGISFEEAKTYEINGRFLVEMTLENSPANIGGLYNGEIFILPENNNTRVEEDYEEQVYSSHNLSR